jgi:hypothetical protein
MTQDIDHGSYTIRMEFADLTERGRRAREADRKLEMPGKLIPVGMAAWSLPDQCARLRVGLIGL